MRQRRIGEANSERKNKFKQPKTDNEWVETTAVRIQLSHHNCETLEVYKFEVDNKVYIGADNSLYNFSNDLKILYWPTNPHINMIKRSRKSIFLNM